MKRLTMKDENGCFLTDKTATVTWNSLIGKNRYRGEAVDRLAAIEDILCDSVGDNDPDAEDEHDLDRLAVMCNQRMTMRDEVSQRFSLTAKIPLDRLREIAEAERDGRCVVLPRLEPGHGDNPGAPGVPRPPGIATVATPKAREQE